MEKSTNPKHVMKSNTYLDARHLERLMALKQKSRKTPNKAIYAVEVGGLLM